jgi:putative transposase
VDGVGSHTLLFDRLASIRTLVRIAPEAHPGYVKKRATVIVLQAFRYELDPNNAERSALASHAGAARYAWNWGLVRVKEALDARQAESAAGTAPGTRVPDAMMLSRTWNVWKKQPGNCSWWARNSKYAYQVAFRDLERALRAFYGSRGRGNHRPVGFPRFKKKGRHDHFKLYGIIRVEERAVVLPRIGRVRLKEHTSKFGGRILSATCRREADRWFVSLCVESSGQILRLSWARR